MSFLLQVMNTGDSTATTNTVVNTTTATVTPEKVDASLNVLDLAVKGGWTMIPIGIMSLVAIYIIIERLVAVGKARREDQNFMNNIKDFIHSGKIDAAVALCRSTHTPIARMLEKGVGRIGHSLADISLAVENRAKLEVYGLEKNLSILATIAGAAPLMGLIGTVTGMVQTFFGIASSGQGVKIDVLAGGVYQAMVATVGGLIVGIIAYIGYNLLVSRVEKVVYKMELRSVEFIEILQTPVK
jgi:biopolymer transport protein ExbB